MSDFLSRLAGRSLGIEPLVQPVIPASTAPPAADGGFAEAESAREVDSRRQVAPPPVPAARVPRNPAEPSHPQAAPVPALPRQESLAVPVLPTVELPIPAPAPQPQRSEPSVETTVPAWDQTLSAAPASPFSLTPAPSAEGRREAAASAAPIVRVTIGRIEVRAEMGSPKSRPAVAPRTKAALSLDDYLKQRVEGRR